MTTQTPDPRDPATDPDRNLDDQPQDVPTQTSDDDDDADVVDPS